MILAFIETHQGQIKKSGLEAMVQARNIAQMTGEPCQALILGACADLSILSEFGAEKVLHVHQENLNSFDSQVYTQVISTVFNTHNGRVLILAHSANGKCLTGRLAVRLKAACVSGVKKVGVEQGKIEVTKDVFAGKAIAQYILNTDKCVLSVMPNAIPLVKSAQPLNVQSLPIDLPEARTKIIQAIAEEGHIPLPEAELVVSAGRGMKGPEQWGIIEDLASALGAATACSRPVADADWRPHHEHVGQTGLAIRPNLYIAVGISGAIQHLAGVNNSKVIVVINKDPEAPFFKAADYGVCGDLFEVVPRLTAAIRAFKNK